LINYYQIDPATDMIVASSGSNFINYNLILSDTSSPYSVQYPVSSSYRDPSSSTSRQIKALYISGSLTALSLIFDSVNFWTDLASIDFSTPSITYTRSLPYMPSNWMSLGLFVSSTVYYVGTKGKIFYSG
jgi:hypothetical protein